jgi:ABC-type ATPase involved in cell division
MLEAMFDVPAAQKATLRWSGDVPHETRDWNVGLIVGPSGCGKSQVLKRLFGDERTMTWGKGAVIDDFDARFSISDVSDICQAVGFNTIPAWMRPHAVLSNGEKFRVEMARRMLEADGPIIVDEFTSVVDRQVATITANAVQKYVRKNGLKFVAASCHYDILDWLQPDWVLEPATMTFAWRELQRRPPVECTIRRVPWDAWRVFAPFHYLTNELHRGAKCFVLEVGGRPAAFAGMLHRPHSMSRNIVGCSRLVTLPDFQGLGLAFALIDRIASAYAALGFRTHTYPAHPALVRAFDRSPVWSLEKKPGHPKSTARASRTATIPEIGNRPCAVFEYRGDAMPDTTCATSLVGRPAFVAKTLRKSL